MKFETVAQTPLAGVESPATDGVPAPRPQAWPTLGVAAAVTLAFVPVARMIALVLDGSTLQYNDYWQMLPRFANSDGSLNAAGLFEFQNHPVAVPQLVYWFNIRLFSGSNISLGMFVVCLALGILAVIAMVLRRSELRPAHQMAVFFLASCLLFTPNGAWNYSKAMSGTAWLSAGLFGVVAVYLRSRDRSVLAFGAAVLAAVSYGTGLMVWPALVAVGACRRPIRQWWREWPYLVGFFATFAWYRQVQVGEATAGAPWPGLLNTIRAVARMLTFPFGLEGSVAEWLGLLILLGIPTLVLWFTFVSRTTVAAAWVGIATFGLLATIGLVIGRYQFITIFGDQNRYASVPALALIGLAGLVALFISDLVDQRTAGRRRPSAGALAMSWAPVAAFAVVAVLAATTGSEHVEQMRRAVSSQELREIALHLDIADDTTYLVGGLGGGTVAVTDLLINIGHQPFVAGWDLDCGLIDKHLDTPPTDSSESVGEVWSGRFEGRLGKSVEITGRIVSDRQIRCVIVTNEASQVAGAATVGGRGLPGTSGDRGSIGFTAIARPGSELYQVFVIFEDDPTPVPVGDFSIDEIEPR